MPPPDEFSEGQSQIIIVSQRSIGFRQQVTIASSAVVELLQSIIRIPRLGSIRPTELDITYGVTDDPSDERVEVFLADGDPAALPDVSALRQRSLWQTAQNWRDQAGADAGNPIQTLSREKQEFWNGSTYIQRAAEFHAERNLMFMTFSTAQTEFLIQGVIFWEEILIQRRWNNDNAFSDLMQEEMWEDN